MISRIVKVEVGLSASADNPYRDLDYSGYHKKPNLIIVLLYNERILSFSLRHKMFSKFVPTLSIPQGLSVFSLSRNRQTAPLPPSSTFLCFVSPCLQLFFRCLARSTKQTWKVCFCFFTDGKQHKARTLHDYS